MPGRTAPNDIPALPAPAELEPFLKNLERQERSPNTLSSYRLDLLHFARWFKASPGETFAAAAVTSTDIREYRGFLLNVERRQPATVNRRLAALRRFFRWAKATGRIKELPTDQVKGVSQVRKGLNWLDKRDTDRLLRTVERGGNRRDLAVLQLLRHTGLRVAEVASPRLTDLQISKRKGQLQVVGKGSKRRTIPLNVDVRRAVEACLKVRPASADDHLLLSSRGTGMSTKAIQELVAKYAHEAGLSEVSPHALRHTFGKSLVEAGVALATVATLLGHERLDTTAIYTTPGQRDLEQAVSKLERDQLELSSRS